MYHTSKINIRSYFFSLIAFLSSVSQAQDSSYLDLNNNQKLLKQDLVESKNTEALPGEMKNSYLDTKVNNFSMLLNNVQIKGNKAISDKDLEKIYTKYIGKNINYSQLVDILFSISQEYKKRGYFLSYVLPDKNFISKDTINIKIIEGSISVKVFDDIKENKLLKKYVSNIESCKPIKKEVYERNIELIKMLPGLDYISKVQINQQAIKDGSSEILNIYILGDQKTLEGLLFIDNTNKYRAQGPLSVWNINKLNNLFSYNEIIKVALETSGSFDVKGDLMLGFHLPLNANGLEFDASIGKRRIIRLQDVAIFDTDKSHFYKAFEQGAKSRKQYIDLKLSNSPILSFTKKFTTSIGFSIEKLVSDRIINTRVVESKKTIEKKSKFYLEGNFYLKDKLKADNYINVKFTSIKNSYNNKNIIKNSPKYNILSFDYSRRDSFKNNFITVLQAEGQYTKSSVDIQDKISYGGGVYGKAYYAPTLSGDNGFNVSAKLMKLLYNKKNKLIYLISPYIYIDSGVVKDKNDMKKNRASSLGAGFEIFMRNGMRLNYSANKQLSKINDSNQNQKKLNHVLTFIVSYNF